MGRIPKTKIEVSNQGYIDKYFKKLFEKVIILLDKNNLAFDFEGYHLMLEEFKSLSDNDFDEAWALIRDILEWKDRINDLISLLEKHYEDSIVEYKLIYSQKSIMFGEDSVVNGNSLARQEKEVDDARRKRNTLKAFISVLKSEVKKLNGAYYYCKKIYEKGWRRFNYSNLY